MHKTHQIRVIFSAVLLNFSITSWASFDVFENLISQEPIGQGSLSQNTFTLTTPETRETYDLDQISALIPVDSGFNTQINVRGSANRFLTPALETDVRQPNTFFPIYQFGNFIGNGSIEGDNFTVTHPENTKVFDLTGLKPLDNFTKITFPQGTTAHPFYANCSLEELQQGQECDTFNSASETREKMGTGTLTEDDGQQVFTLTGSGSQKRFGPVESLEELEPTKTVLGVQDENGQKVFYALSSDLPVGSMKNARSF